MKTDSLIITLIRLRWREASPRAQSQMLLALTRKQIEQPARARFWGVCMAMLW